VSEHSRRDMTKYYRLGADRIRIVPEGVDTRLFRPIRDRAFLSEWRRSMFEDERPFLLYVGKPTRRRNLPNLLAAFRVLIREHHLPHRLLLIGTALPGTGWAGLVDRLELTNEVMAVPYARHEDIAVAYNAADALVYPSDYEGFGMPVLEAMACGAPVIALDNTAFPEFAGGVAMLLPDARVETLVEGLLDLLADSERRARMAVEGPRRAAAYDWHIIARRYADLLTSLAHG
jgi:glycosyltransferase involved in cell wall biosynthesis